MMQWLQRNVITAKRLHSVHTSEPIANNPCRQHEAPARSTLGDPKTLINLTNEKSDSAVRFISKFSNHLSGKCNTLSDN